MKIRKMTLADLPAVMAIEKKSFIAPWSFVIFLQEVEANSFAQYFVAETDKIVGYIGIWTIMEVMHITNIAVDPASRRQGIGKKLLAKAFSLACMKDVQEITLEVRLSNTIARELYKEMGFLEIGIRPGYYTDNNEDAMIMTLFLTGAKGGKT